MEQVIPAKVEDESLIYTLKARALNELTNHGYDLTIEDLKVFKAESEDKLNEKLHAESGETGQKVGKGRG